MKTLLHLQDLQKSFGQQLVLNHVGFELHSGEIIGLIGPSGAGKSTMIKTMLGMEKADSGIALVLENTMPNRHILGDIGYMAHQMPYMMPYQVRKICNFSVSSKDFLRKTCHLKLPM